MQSRSAESRVWVYAIAAGSSTTLDVSGPQTPEQTQVLGFDNAPIIWTPVGNLQVAISDSQSTRCDEQLDRYHKICMALSHNLDALPMRFGTQLTYGHLCSQLATYEPEFLRTLTRIRGCCEIAIRWAITESDLPKQTHESTFQLPYQNGSIAVAERPGTQYLTEKLKQSRTEQDAKQAALACGESLQELWPDAIRSIRSNTRRLGVSHNQSLHDHNATVQYIVIALTLLVQKCTADEVIESAKVQKLFAHSPALVTGPWPPFSFATT